MNPSSTTPNFTPTWIGNPFDLHGKVAMLVAAGGGIGRALDPYLTKSCKAIGDEYGLNFDRMVPAPLAPAELGGLINAYYRADAFGTGHPGFNGLPGRGILDYTLYRNIIPQWSLGLSGIEAPDELIVGSIRAQYGYLSNVQTAAFLFGAGKFLFNTLRIRESLGKDPVAEMLLRNLLNSSGQSLNQPAADLPADLQQQLKAIGYE